MKKHRTSLQSTNHAEERSISSYSPAPYKPIINHKLQLDKLFKTLHQILTLRSYLLFRDLQEVYSSSTQFLLHILNISTPQQLMKFGFPNKSFSDKLYEKDQISLFVKIILELNKQKQESARDGRMKDFQMYKELIDYFQQKTVKYELWMRQLKQKQQIITKIKQHDQKQEEFNRIQSSVIKNMANRQRRIMSSFIENKVRQDKSHEQERERTLKQQQYKMKGSKLLSQAKDMSLRVKLSPYASQLKREYDYDSLNSRLSRTIDLDVQRKVALMDRMKRVEREKRNKQCQRRYSVLQDRMMEEQRLEQKSLNFQRQKMRKFFNNELEQVTNSSKTKKNTLLTSLKKSLNAFNMHQESKQIRKILQHHKNNAQFQNDISMAGSLSNINQYSSPYATISYKMSLSTTNEDKNNTATKREQKRILCRFSKNNEQFLKSNKQMNEDFNIVSSFIESPYKIKKEKSLVALYDNQLKENKQ